MRLYHPNLGREITCPSERSAAVLMESGWKPAPEPEAAEPGKEPEPVRYEPVTAKAESKPKRAAKSEPKGDDTPT